MPPTSDRPLVYLIGTAGNPHYGDEVITASWLRFYAERLPEAEIWLDTPRPGQTSVLHGGSHPHLRCVDTLFHACWNAPSDDPEDCVQFGRDVIEQPGILAREASGFSVARRADLVHVLGGGYINAVWPRHLTLLSAASAIGERSGGRTVLTGAGLTPTTPPMTTALGELLSTFDLVDLRDQPSADLLGEAVPTVSMTGDDAFLDLQRQPIDRRTRARYVVEIQSDLIDTPLEALADQATRHLESWGATGADVLVLESLPPGDLAVLPLIRERFPDAGVLPFEPLWANGLPVSPKQRWVTTRFHSHLMAAASGAWGVALGASDMIASQHQSLLDRGSGWALLRDPAADATASAPTNEPFGGEFATIVSDKRSVADSVLDGLR